MPSDRHESKWFPHEIECKICMDADGALMRCTCACNGTVGWTHADCSLDVIREHGFLCGSCGHSNMEKIEPVLPYMVRVRICLVHRILSLFLHRLLVLTICLSNPKFLVEKLLIIIRINNIRVLLLFLIVVPAFLHIEIIIFFI